MKTLVFISFIAVFAVACQRRASSDTALFALLPSSKTHVDFVNSLENKNLNILQYMYYYNGGGVAAGDINNDGWIDLYFTSNEGANRLYLNRGNFEFDDITEQAGVSCAADWSTGVTMIDINSDGFLDLYVCQVSDFKGLTGHNRLFINNGDLTFTEQAASFGLNFSGFSTQSVFFDYDQDGDLDMYLLNHSVHSVRSYGPSELRKEKDSLAGDRLYRNNFSEGRSYFEDVTHESGIYSSHIGYGLGVAVSDINGDGWPDIYVSNDFHENDYLYINQRNGTFQESLEQIISHTSRYSMGNDIADINADGWPDIVTVDMLPNNPSILLKSGAEDTQEVYDIKKNFGYGSQYVRNCLQLNQGDHFVEIGQWAGIEATDWSWSPLICDFDNDSKPEIFITNGIYKRPNDLDYIQFTADIANSKNINSSNTEIESKMINRMPTLKISNAVFVNRGELKFDNRSEEWGLAEPSYSNGAIYADLDNDGDQDLVVNNVNQQAFIYQNNSTEKLHHHFLQVELRSDTNTYGIGAKVKIHSGNQNWQQEMMLTRGFQSSVSPVLTFGLGATTSVDSVEIFWRDRKSQVLRDPGINKRLVVQENRPLSVIREIDISRKEKKPFQVEATSIPYQYVENDFKDYAVEPLIPYLLSREGPAVAVADVNGDQLDDIFLGGPTGQSGKIFIQNKEGKFSEVVSTDLMIDFQHEDVDAAFFDANKDGHLDLYVVSGGNEFSEWSPLLADRLYINNGKGIFTRSRTSLPTIHLNGACVLPIDVDRDGHTDLFVGNRSVPGHYGLSPKSYLLRNDGKGTFQVHQIFEMGMITDAASFDYNGDGWNDLVVSGDWMPITIYENINARFEPLAKPTGLEKFLGWWRCLELADVNGDGRMDIFAGNAGGNLKLRPTQEEPVTLYLNDFDDNGKPDPVIFYYLGGKQIPFNTKAQLSKQMPFINKRFTSFQAFAAIERPNDLLPVEKIKGGKKLIVNNLFSHVFISTGDGSYSSETLPYEVQFSLIQNVAIGDFNSDGYQDIFMIGNSTSHTANLGNADSQSLVLVLGDINGKFNFQNLSRKANFSKEYHFVKLIKRAGRSTLLLVGNSGLPEFLIYP
ncbi:MAG: VCBS repeat-containing protein [Cyclobacteriaceae bacterium]|nr:VCBS repeat-containing protein [Cyclobacteriaceae bacterium]